MRLHDDSAEFSRVHGKSLYDLGDIVPDENAFKPQVRTNGEVSGEDEQVRSSDLASKLDNLRVPEQRTQPVHIHSHVRYPTTIQRASQLRQVRTDLQDLFEFVQSQVPSPQVKSDQVFNRHSVIDRLLFMGLEKMPVDVLLLALPCLVSADFNKAKPFDLLIVADVKGRLGEGLVTAPLRLDGYGPSLETIELFATDAVP